MASVAFVTTEHDEACLSPAKLPQVPGVFPGSQPPGYSLDGRETCGTSANARRISPSAHHTSGSAGQALSMR